MGKVRGGALVRHSTGICEGMFLASTLDALSFGSGDNAQVCNCDGLRISCSAVEASKL